MAEDSIERLRKLSESLIDPEFAVQLFEYGYPDGVVVVDEGGYIRLVNKRFEEIFGYHRSQLYDQVIDTLVPDSVRADHGAHREGYVMDPHVRPSNRHRNQPLAHCDCTGQFHGGHSKTAQARP